MACHYLFTMLSINFLEAVNIVLFNKLYVLSEILFPLKNMPI